MPAGFILSYHRISDDDDPLAVSPRRFRHQMEVLAAEGFQVVGLSRLLPGSKRARSFRARWPQLRRRLP
jgi:hypothetical protein